MADDGWPARSVLDCGSPLPLSTLAQRPHARQSARGLAHSKTWRSFVVSLVFLAAAVSGTIGQPDAGGPMTNGPYSLVGGFWGIVAAIQTPGAPLLSIERTNGSVRVFWPVPATGFVLDQTANLVNAPLTNAWTQVPFPYQTNATHISITVPASAGNQFYRLRKP